MLPQYTRVKSDEGLRVSGVLDTSVGPFLIALEPLHVGPSTTEFVALTTHWVGYNRGKHPDPWKFRPTTLSLAFDSVGGSLCEDRAFEFLLKYLKSQGVPPNELPRDWPYQYMRYA